MHSSRRVPQMQWNVNQSEYTKIHTPRNHKCEVMFLVLCVPETVNMYTELPKLHAFWIVLPAYSSGGEKQPAPTLSVSQCLTRAHIFGVSMSQCPGTTLSVSQWHGVQGSDFQCPCVLGPHFQCPSDMVSRAQTFSVPVSWDHTFSVPVTWCPGFRLSMSLCLGVPGPHYQCPSVSVSRAHTFSVPVSRCPWPTRSMFQCLGVLPGPPLQCPILSRCSGPTLSVPRCLSVPVCISVQFSSRWYLCARKSPYALHCVYHKFPQCRLWNMRLRLRESCCTAWMLAWRCRLTWRSQ